MSPANALSGFGRGLRKGKKDGKSGSGGEKSSTERKGEFFSLSLSKASAYTMYKCYLTKCVNSPTATDGE